MLISHEKKILFVHIQKTGGTSIAKILKNFIPDVKEYLGTHDHASLAKEALGNEYGSYYRFAFVRNPWDRLVSWYMMIKQKANVIPPAKQNRLFKYVLNNSSSFEDFILNCTQTIDDVDGRKSFLYNQYSYISDANGTLIIDFVGKYEAYGSDLGIVLDRIGLRNVEIPHINKSEHLHYETYYTKLTRDIIAERYERDIREFGYSFEDHLRNPEHHSRD
jgi:chondroitin 4-sulfotransferase 11